MSASEVPIRDDYCSNNYTRDSLPGRDMFVASWLVYYAVSKQM